MAYVSAMLIHYFGIRNIFNLGYPKNAFQILLTTNLYDILGLILSPLLPDLNYSVAQSCLILCEPMDCSTPDFPILHHLPEFVQTHVHRVGDDIQPSHSLLSPYPPAFNFSQHQSLFQWVHSSNQVARVLELQLQIPIISVQLLSSVQLFDTLRNEAHQASLSIKNSQNLLKLMCIESVMPSNHFILCHPLLLLSVFPSIMVFSSESVLHIRWPKYWSFSFSICPSSEYSGLISFMIDWLDLLAVQGTLKSLLQHHSSKASILQHSAFFRVQLSHPYMTTGKTIDLTRCWPLLAK